MPRTFALLLIGLGLAGTAGAFAMPINAPGTDLANLPLMAERQDILMVSAVAFLSGVILLAADYVASANPEVRRASPVQWRTWSEHAALRLHRPASIGESSRKDGMPSMGKLCLDSFTPS